ncbi:hypothetical protein [Stutzerimonas nitrititolerans]|uniref:hypothetical protein n=1 Tax=Stutzerimonas nitrititolerans TaxID=2482751 RepID=UPI00289B31D1|nr:hypothetical protein [Stutzerimonas nitrititolerans]
MVEKNFNQQAGLATSQDEREAVEVMLFQLKHPDTGDTHTVAFTRSEIASGMEDTLFEKLGDLICDCQPVGETNVVECSCSDYIDEFELVNAAPVAQTERTDCEWCAGAGHDPYGETCPHCKAAQTELVEALGSMTCAYRMAIQAGHARITALGGDCDSVERMLADFPEYGKAVELYKSHRAALAPHGGE